MSKADNELKSSIWYLCSLFLKDFIYFKTLIQKCGVQLGFNY